MSAPKRILYLSYDGLTDPLGQSQILPYLEGLALRGYSITIVSFEKPDRFKTGYDSIQNRCDKHFLKWIPLTYHKKPPVLSTLFDLFQLRKIVQQEHAKESISVVHCRSYLTALVGLWMKRKFDIRFIFDMRGFWADERVEGGLWNLKNPLYNLVYQYFKKKEKKFIQQSDSTIVLTEAAKAEIISWGIDQKITVIPCCVDLALFDGNHYTAAEKKDFRSMLGISKDTFVLLYLGSIGTWYQWEAMVSFFEELKVKKADAKFLILTPDHNQIKNSPDYIIRSATRSEVPSYISIADASVCFIQPSFSKKGSSATKMAEVLAMGVPVIVNRGWGDIDFLNGKVNNLLIIDNDEDVVVDKMIWQKPVLQSHFFDEFFSLESGISKYDSVYQTVTSRNSLPQ